MPKVARLYLDTARLGLMSPSAQLAARDFARLAADPDYLQHERARLRRMPLNFD